MRIAPGDSQGSAVVGRTLSRQHMVAMPPLGTEVPDMVGAQQLADWIDSLQP